MSFLLARRSAASCFMTLRRVWECGRFRSPSAAVDQAFHVATKLVHLERLLKKRVRAELARARANGVVGVRGHEDDGRRPPSPAQARRDGQTVDAGHPDVR